MRAKRILVTSQEGPEGAYFPNLGLAQALVEDGHEVYFHGPRWTRRRAAAAGCVPLTSPEGQLYEAHLGQKASLSEQLEKLETAVGLDVVRVIEKRRLDCVIVDGLAHYGPAVAAEKMGLPWLTFVNRPWDLSVESGQSSLARTRTDELRTRLGLPPSGKNAYQECLSDRLVLIGWTPAFDPRPAPPQGLHVGPLPWNEPAKRPRWLEELREPIVLVAVSTSPAKIWADFERRLFPIAAAAVKRLGVRCVVVMSGLLRKLPANQPHARFVHYLPHNLLMPVTSVMIGHGAWGQVGRALAHGIPMLLVTSEKGTIKNGQLCRRNGVAATLELGELSVQTVAGQLEGLLRPDSPVRRQAQKVARVLRCLDPPAAAARAVRAALAQ